MSSAHTFLILTIGIAMILAAGCTQQAADNQAATGTPVVTMTNPVAPVPVASTNGINIAYELELNGLDGKAFVPETIKVIDPATGKVI